jgi:hypothetical protein
MTMGGLPNALDDQRGGGGGWLYGEVEQPDEDSHEK